MKRTIITLVLAMAGLSFVYAQTADEPSIEAPSTEAPSIETPSTEAPPTDTKPSKKPANPESKFVYEPIRKGDQFFRVGLGIGIPLFNLGANGEVITNTKMNLGGTGTLGFSRFVTSKIALGGEIAFSFNSTLGDNLYFYLPLIFKTSYVFVFDRIQVPVSVGVGGAFQAYNTTNYFGLIVRPEIAAYYQFSPDWSFGASVDWNCLPQWYSNSTYNRTGNILDALVSVRYHF